ncbi:MAG: IS256 family transposase, partial [Alphaproteobacteria bacterium]
MPKKKDPLEVALDAMVDGASSAEDVMEQLRLLKKRALERMLSAEMDEHLGYEKHAPEGFDGGNSRNGTSKKRLITEDGELEIEVPRDREGTFEPQVVRKRQRRLQGFDDKVIALYARGMSTRDIQAHLEEIYEVDVSPSLISRVTEQVREEVLAWQSRPLDPVYPIVYFDALVVKTRDHGTTQNRSVYVVFAIDMRGMKQVLGLWVADHEGAKFWMQVVTELRNRGVDDVLFACVDGLKGFPEAIEAVFPRTTVQTCVVHMVRNSLNLVAWKNRKAIAAGLRTVYRAPTEQAALDALEQFDAEWGARYPSIVRSWRDNWQRIAPFFGYPPELRRAIYTTNPIEGLHRQLRKVLKTRGAFPTEDAVIKVLWLAIDRASRKWTYPKQNWDLVLQQLV